MAHTLLSFKRPTRPRVYAVYGAPPLQQLSAAADMGYYFFPPSKLNAVSDTVLSVWQFCRGYSM